MLLITSTEDEMTEIVTLQVFIMEIFIYTQPLFFSCPEDMYAGHVNVQN